MHQDNNPQPHTSWITIALLCIAVGAFLVFTQRDELVLAYREVFPDEVALQEGLPESHSYTDIVNAFEPSTTNSNADNTLEDSTQTTIPTEYLLDVPFTTQAPNANWDLPYQEACEEASALVVDFYYKEKIFTPAVADEEILKLVDFENKTYGGYKDTTAAETATFIKEYFGYTRVDVINNPTPSDIKWHVVQGRPVIVLAAGKLLENDHFRNDGPLYHMFVITGYTTDEFITNDVGTRFGENFRYSIENVMTSMHDWNGGDVANGAKRIIVVYPNN